MVITTTTNASQEVPNPVMPPPRRFSAAPTLTCPHRSKSSSHSSSSLHHTYSIDSSESMITVIPANNSSTRTFGSAGSGSTLPSVGACSSTGSTGTGTGTVTGTGTGNNNNNNNTNGSSNQQQQQQQSDLKRCSRGSIHGTSPGVLSNLETGQSFNFATNQTSPVASRSPLSPRSPNRCLSPNLLNVANNTAAAAAAAISSPQSEPQTIYTTTTDMQVAGASATDTTTTCSGRAQTMVVVRTNSDDSSTNNKQSSHLQAAAASEEQQTQLFQYNLSTFGHSTNENVTGCDTNMTTTTTTIDPHQQQQQQHQHHQQLFVTPSGSPNSSLAVENGAPSSFNGSIRTQDELLMMDEDELCLTEATNENHGDLSEQEGENEVDNLDARLESKELDNADYADLIEDYNDNLGIVESIHPKEVTTTTTKAETTQETGEHFLNSLDQDPSKLIVCETINDFCARHSQEELQYLVEQIEGLKINECYFSERNSSLCVVIQVGQDYNGHELS